jgi:biotin-dependent carboxylase-like uncharacterized protein
MVEVLKAGLFDTIQDLGRVGVQQFGVPLSGAMDQYSAKLANAILGNAQDAAVLEFTLLGPTLKFCNATAICIMGMECQAKINKAPIQNNRYVLIKKDDVLSFGKRELGCRGYLAVLGGFQSEKVMKSRSFYSMVISQERLKTGNVLKIRTVPVPAKVSNAMVKTPKAHSETLILEVFKGVEFASLSADQKQQLFSTTFTITKDSNRMAYQLQEGLLNDLHSILTSAVLPGTIQLTPSGQLMVLMRDCQTTGGYPRILQLSEMAINRLSQKAPGDKFRFKILSY